MGEYKTNMWPFAARVMIEKSRPSNSLGVQHSTLGLWFGDEGAIGHLVANSRGELRGVSKSGNRDQKMAPFASGHTHICSQQRTERKGIAGVCHSLEYFRRRSAAGGAPLLATLGTGSVGDSLHSVGFRTGPSAGFPHPAG